jgi:hypothetical protein
MEEDHAWSDSIEDGHRYAREEDAYQAAERAKVSAAKSGDWFPKIRVVSFPGGGR